MLTTNKILQKKASSKKYAVGAFNVYNMESIQAVISAAHLEKSPAIIATTESSIKYASHNVIASMIKILATPSKIPFSMHLDHGRNPDIIKKCIKLGYTSVMIDASNEKIKKNIQITKKIVKLAHKQNVSVEAELGTIGGTEDNISSRKIILTDPQIASEFAKQTGCDTLAIAIGTSHGAYKFSTKSHLDIKRLQEIRKLVKIPLVLHGASEIPQSIVNKAKKFGAKLGHPRGVSEKDISAAIKYGISKINIDSDLRLTFDASVREFLHKKPEVFGPRKILGPAREAITEQVRYKMRLFKSSHKTK